MIRLILVLAFLGTTLATVSTLEAGWGRRWQARNVPHRWQPAYNYHGQRETRFASPREFRGFGFGGYGYGSGFGPDFRPGL